MKIVDVSTKRLSLPQIFTHQKYFSVLQNDHFQIFRFFPHSFTSLGNPADRLKKNGIVVGKVSKILSNAGLLIKLPFHKCGFAHVTELHDEYRENPLQSFKTKMFVR